MIHLKAFLLRLLVVLALCLGMSAHADAQITPLKKGATIALPEFTLLDGTRVNQEALKDKPVVIEFWASWCPYCARQNPYIQKLHEKMDDAQMQVITVSIDKEMRAASDYMKKHGYTFKAARYTPQVKAIFGEIKVIPLVYVIDKNRVVREIIPGEMFEEDVMDLRKYAN